MRCNARRGISAEPVRLAQQPGEYGERSGSRVVPPDPAPAPAPEDGIRLACGPCARRTRHPRPVQASHDPPREAVHLVRARAPGAEPRDLVRDRPTGGAQARAIPAVLRRPSGGRQRRGDQLSGGLHRGRAEERGDFQPAWRRRAGSGHQVQDRGPGVHRSRRAHQTACRAERGHQRRTARRGSVAVGHARARVSADDPPGRVLHLAVPSPGGGGWGRDPGRLRPFHSAAGQAR